MLKKSSYTIVTLCLFIIPIIITSYKYYNNKISIHDIIPREVYEVSLELDIPAIPKKAHINSYLPQSDDRQIIGEHHWQGDSLEIEYDFTNEGLKVSWLIDGKENVFHRHIYEVETKEVNFEIPDNSPFEVYVNKVDDQFLSSEKFIQSTDPLIDSLARALKSNTVYNTLKANFTYVYDIEVSNTRVLTDALSALKLGRASCNGKSRLFTALCRAQGIPSRVVGGTILENAKKRTTHLWSEVYYGGQWIPFDVMNNHFARLPANYLELYRGDEFLFSYSDHLDFDYQFVIEKKYHTFDESKAKGPDLWPLLSEFHVSLNLLRALLLLPLAALIIAIIRNVVGLKTFGVLLPALIGLALVNIDISIGLTAFIIVILVVAVLHLLLAKWSLLHIPKVAIILTCVILTLLFLNALGTRFNLEFTQMMIYLPIVIVSITAERFAKVLTEESMQNALKMLMHTFLVAFLTCIIFRSKVVLGFFLTYPEHYLTILFVLLVLGRWIGMRVTEYSRFRPALF